MSVSATNRAPFGERPVQTPEAWRQAWSALPADLGEALRGYAARIGEAPLPYFQARLVGLCQESPLLYVGLFLDGELCFEYGALPPRWSAQSLSEGPVAGEPGLYCLLRERWRVDQQLRLCALSLNRSSDAAASACDLEILRFAGDYLFHDPARRDDRVIDVLSAFEYNCEAIIQQNLELRRPITLAHFEFPGLAPYMELAGEARSRELMEEIITNIRKRMKKDDYLVQPAPGAYVALLPGARAAQIRERFHTIFFQVRSLVLDHRLHLCTVEGAPRPLNEIWKELLL